MKKEKQIYYIYLALMFIFSVSIIAVPFLMFSNEDNAGIYNLFSPLCHQKLSRSYCLFESETGYYIDNCTPQEGALVPSDAEQLSSELNGDLGYKFPVCSRDMGLYLAMFIGAAVYPFIRRIDNRTIPPAVYLILAIIPLAVDGSVQFFSDLGIIPFVYESTNILRLITGVIAGFAVSIYLIPLLVNLFSDSKTR